MVPTEPDLTFTMISKATYSLPHACPRSTFRVSGFILEPTNIVSAPIMMFNASTNGK